MHKQYGLIKKFIQTTYFIAKSQKNQKILEKDKIFEKKIEICYKYLKFIVTL